MSLRDLIAGFCCWFSVLASSCGFVQQGYPAYGLGLLATFALVLLVARRYL